MTAIHHYWLRPGVPIVPVVPAVFAWPCFPEKLTVQGTGAVINPDFPNSLYGKLTADPWTGGPPDTSPCNLVMFRNAGEQTAQSTVMGYFDRGAEWCLESRIGWAAEDFGLIVVYPLGWTTSSVRVRYIPTGGEVALFIGATIVRFAYPPGLLSGVLHHWAMTYANSVIRVWLNGALIMTHPYTVPPVTGTGIAVRYENALYGELYVGGVRYWAAEHYTAPFTPPTQLTIP